MQQLNQRLMLITVLAICLCCASCFGDTSKKSGAVIYPDGWPIPELVAPPGSGRSTVGGFEECTAIIRYTEGRPNTQYLIGFHLTQGMNAQDAMDHFNGILKELGFRKQKEMQERPFNYSYVLEDNKTRVTLVKITDRNWWQLYINIYDDPIGDEYRKATPIP